jgi:pimeloyl-ACP methyl ester carboxylesterase
LLLAVGGVVLLAPVALASPLTFAHCKAHQLLVSEPKGVECATLQVPLLPEAPTLGTLSLAVQRVPASAPLLGTIVLLAGGPGQANIPPFDEILAPLAKEAALRGYQLVSFDQRGTGESGALSCPGLIRQGLSELTKCGETLGTSRGDYTSQDSVDDLDALRQALGAAPLSLFAVSYGGKVAGMYALEHPEGVARMVLDSPVPVSGWDPLSSQRTRALPRVLNDELCGGGACRSFAGDPQADLEAVVARLHDRPVRARILNASRHRRVVSVTESRLYQLLADTDLSSSLAGLVPAAIAAADLGDWAPLARLTSALPAYSPSGEAVEELINSVLSVPLLAATLCSETPLPWSPESLPTTRVATLAGWLSAQPVGVTAPFAPATAATLAGAGFCEGWPSATAAPPPPTGRSATPTLILSGDEDLRTPYEEDLTIASGYTGAQILRVPDAGHSTVTSDRTGCARQAMIAFLADQPVPSSCPGTSSEETVPPPPSSLSRVRPAGSRSGLAGRGAAAFVITLREVVGQPATSGGGFSGGSWRLAKGDVVFNRLSDIPGVAISGRLNVQKLTGSFTIDGRAAGKLTLENATLKGRLAGAVVHLHLAL